MTWVCIALMLVPAVMGQVTPLRAGAMWLGGYQTKQACLDAASAQPLAWQHAYVVRLVCARDSDVEGIVNTWTSQPLP